MPTMLGGKPAKNAMTWLRRSRFALCLRRQHRSLNVAAKAFPWHQLIDGLKRIALRRESRQPIIRIEESELHHRASPRIMPSGSKLARVRKIGYFSIMYGKAGTTPSYVPGTLPTWPMYGNWPSLTARQESDRLLNPPNAADLSQSRQIADRGHRMPPRG
jgi:hypothetical protein